MKKIIIFLLLVLILIGLYFLSITKKEQVKTIEQATEVNTDENKYPALNLPLNYFDQNKYKSASLDIQDNYQSYPTTNITMKKYSSEIRNLTKPSYESIINQNKVFDEKGKFKWVAGEHQIKDNYSKYGYLALHFLGNSLEIEEMTQADVDGDGQKEKIITANYLNRADGGSQSSFIVKGNDIIFSAEEDRSIIRLSETGKGFYVTWQNEEFGVPRCCPSGHIKTRFIFHERKFVPLYEQEVRYMKVGGE